MIQTIFETLTQGGQAFITFLSNMLTAVMNIFGSTAENGTYSLNAVGILTIVGVAISFVYFVIRWVTRLIKLRA